MMNAFSKISVLLVVLCIFLTIDVNAANRYFKMGSNSWNSAAHWSAVSSAGVDNASVPKKADIAIFDLNSGSCVINTTVNCKGIQINAGYSGVITQGAFEVNVGNAAFIQMSGSFVASSKAININGAFTLSGGSFNGGSSAINVTGNFVLSAGVFISTSSNLTLAYTNSIATDVFVHNNGTVSLTGAAVTIVSGNYFNLTLNKNKQVLTLVNNCVVNNT